MLPRAGARLRRRRQPGRRWRSRCPGASSSAIDAAPGAIAHGRSSSTRSGWATSTLDAAVDRGLRAGAGGFDYVIAHGVYSWVPPRSATPARHLPARAAARGRRLRQLQRAARRAPARGAARHAASSTPPALADPRERIAQARALLRFLLEGCAGARLGARCAAGRARWSTASDANLLHDELAEVNDAVYFHEFVAHAARHGLQYLAEADFFEMQIGEISEPVAEALSAVEDPVRREQYLDFLKGRMFRQTLLCRAERAIDRTPRPEVLERLAVSTPARARRARRRRRRDVRRPDRLDADHRPRARRRRARRVCGAWPAAAGCAICAGDDAERRRACDALLRSLRGQPRRSCTSTRRR